VEYGRCVMQIYLREVICSYNEYRLHVGRHIWMSERMLRKPRHLST